jgi:hypothetical protein
MTSAVPNILEVLEQPDVPGVRRAVRPLVGVVVRQAHEDDRSVIEAAPQQPVAGNISRRRAALPRSPSPAAPLPPKSATAQN